jgi:L-ascorbate metabolism protein UlaG (beta-lactamase superfamily)
MEITFVGHSCFKIKGDNLTLVIDPYDPKALGYKLPKLSADVVLTTHGHADHAHLDGVNDYRLVIETPGEYEVAGTFVTGIKTFHDANEGKDRGPNTIYQIEMDGFNLLHLGDLGHELQKDTLERLVEIDVLMIPVGGFFTIDAKTAVKVISSIEPAIVIPMHYKTDDLEDLGEKLDDLKTFLEEMGSGDNSIKKTDKLKLTSRSSVPSESEVYVLSPQH